ncbi:hypothetical protein B296_00023897 [Ensete ventricosum]|uniref:Uncharacterized protein n=1 Tax=Ensete ventricosum TaxID=4639 RepID=A0A426X6Y3_ENSVE|nr:hypothetical protein B296_00023897 [Ensete ventricosum]
MDHYPLATVNPAPIAAQPPPFLALEFVPRLGEKSRRPSMPEIADSSPGSLIAGATVGLPRLNSLRSDRR